MRAVAAGVILGDRDHASLRCPAHDDRRPSVSVTEDDEGVVLVHCHAGCPTEYVVAAFGLSMGDLFPAGHVPSVARRSPPRLSQLPPPEDRATPLPPRSARRWIDRLAAKRGWDPAVLDGLGCTAVGDQQGTPRVRFPFMRAGRVVYWQDRRVLDGDPRWMSPRGRVPCPFGADRITVARERGHGYIVEGISDTVALLHELPRAAVFGIPGACGFRPQWADAFRGLTVWVLADADAAGRKLRIDVTRRLAGRARIHHVGVPPPWKDVDEWRQGAGDGFHEEFQKALQRACEGG